jgi:hypothetical protein
MNNDFDCSMMMFSSSKKHGISYKNGQSGYRVYHRKYYHNFKVAVNSNNFEGSHGVNLGKRNEYIIAHGKNICIFDDASFEVKLDWDI